jgi:hypothetical protein
LQLQTPHAEPDIHVPSLRRKVGGIIEKW